MTCLYDMVTVVVVSLYTGVEDITQILNEENLEHIPRAAHMCKWSK